MERMNRYRYLLGAKLICHERYEEKTAVITRSMSGDCHEKNGKCGEDAAVVALLASGEPTYGAGVTYLVDRRLIYFYEEQ